MEATTLTAPPRHLNGYPVIEALRHPNCFTVMVEKPGGELVVATWWPELKSAWSWGHYTTRQGLTQKEVRQKAGRDFNEAAARNEKR